MKPFRIEVLKKQNRKDFDCGTEVLNRYLKEQAGQEQRNKFCVCYVLLETKTNSIAGYYILSATSIQVDGLPESVRKKLPRYPQDPAARVGRLAVDQRNQGQGIGSLLLADAVKRASASHLGVYAIVVDAKDANAISFCQHFGFIPFQNTPDILFLPIVTKKPPLSGPSLSA